MTTIIAINVAVIAFLTIFAAGAVMSLVVLLRIAMLWWRCRQRQLAVSLPDILAMRFRKVDAVVIVNALCMAADAGLPPDELTSMQLQALFLAGGNVENVVAAMIEARSRNIDLTFETAQSIDLSGVDVLYAVQTGTLPDEPRLD